MIPSSHRRVFLLCALLCIAVRASAAPVNINSADAPTLARELKGIGLKRAQAIVDYRTKNGPFKSADELALVKGIGRQAIDKNRGEIRLDAGVKPVTKAPVMPSGNTIAAPARKSGVAGR